MIFIKFILTKELSVSLLMIHLFFFFKLWKTNNVIYSSSQTKFNGSLFFFFEMNWCGIVFFNACGGVGMEMRVAFWNWMH